MTIEPENPSNLPADVYGSPIENPCKRWKIIQRSCDQHIFSNYVDYVCKDRKVVARIMDDLQLSVGKAMPDTYNTDFNMETDESFSRIFFYGIGCVLLYVD